MNKLLLLSACVLFVYHADAQITIDQSDFPGADDTALVSVSDDTSLDLTQTGTDFTWDYSTLHIMSQRIDTFFNLSDASALYQLQFNNFILQPDYASDYYYDLIGFELAGAEDVGIAISDPVGFVKITSSVVQNVGLGLNLNGYEVPMASDTIDTEYELPMSYGDAWTSDSYIYVDLNPAFNGIFQRYQYRTSEVDGWGTITTRFGTFDAIRVRSELMYDDSAYVDFGFGGTWLELPTPDEVHYTWWSEGNKIPVMKVVAQIVGGNEVITRVEFKDQERNLASIEESESFAGEIYPNPANGNVTVVVEPGVQQIEVYSVSGQIMLTEQVNSNQIQLNVADWTTGVYVIKLYSADGISATKLIVE
ncbi:MAG: T9SS type A sorting domain-containing protein [Crocinitomicaceae bacterium]|nr:T9SS type A sorting domain-containing protein [Crocinitomicaceae bacterium]MBK8926810.1 T9SS type A sorting domain-containing protein [Crocinitomicaceae bacterium]